MDVPNLCALSLSPHALPPSFLHESLSLSFCLSVSICLVSVSVSLSLSPPSLLSLSLSLSPFSRPPSLSPPLFLFPPPVLFFTSLFSVITSITHFGLFLKPLYFTYRYPASTIYIYIYIVYQTPLSPSIFLNNSINIQWISIVLL